MASKAAVVIGVDRTGGLEPLETAARGATDVADWLTAEGYVVKLLTDATGPLHASSVRDALGELVTNPAQYELLVVYFSGHGSWLSRTDLWLFSGAPTDTGDAINLAGAMDLARYSGIETVVFISDACRSIPDSVAGQQMSGIDAFPNLDFDTPSKIDYVKATGKARAAFEAAIPTAAGGTGGRESVLTKAWRVAYDKPTTNMVLEVDLNGAKTPVVPNRRLEDYLQPKVEELLAAVDPGLSQILEINIPSRDDVFIARANTVDRLTPPFPATSGATSVLVRGVTTPAPPGDGALAPQIEHLLPQHSVISSYESGCGFVFDGDGIADAESTKGRTNASAEIVNNHDPALLRVWNVSDGVSVVVKFESGRTTVLPALQGYIGHVTVDRAGVSNVSYVLSSGDERYLDYQQDHEEIDRLRAMVALSVDRNRFHVRDGADAQALADAIRTGKALDPSLGLYAAVAYSQAGNDEGVLTVLNYMGSDLGISIFDLVVLASRHIDRDDYQWVPFCPVLTQNWNLLRPREFELPEPLHRARRHRLDSLWTTFSPELGGDLLAAVRDGSLT